MPQAASIHGRARVRLTPERPVLGKWLPSSGEGRVPSGHQAAASCGAVDRTSGATSRFCLTSCCGLVTLEAGQAVGTRL